LINYTTSTETTLSHQLSPHPEDRLSTDTGQKTKVAVAMSGGVDSSVAAALMVNAGYDVFGIMLRLWSEPGSESTNRCCTPDAMALAKQVAAQLSIPFYPIDAKNVFYDQVVEPFIDGYEQGITPNPCLQCNRHIRWKFMLNHALAFGATTMVTGHYARLESNSTRIKLLKAKDLNKDQSYVLHVLDQRQISKAQFPLGDYTKVEVRQLAEDFGLPVAEKSESQDLCFLGTGNYREFLERNSTRAFEHGEITNSKGVKLGQHTGLPMYTIGQRRGLGISTKNPSYVLDKDMDKNTLIVGTKDELNHQDLLAKNVNWVSIAPPSEPIKAFVKIRYKSAEVPAEVVPMGDGSVKVHFDRPVKGITPGQAAVFYDGDVCLGGGIIQTAKK
jgi:tRNA-specific 2-thiouridylase